MIAISAPPRPNELVVDLDAVESNARLVRGLAHGQRIFAAVKANGYGLGLPAVAEALAAGGVDAFSCADLADAERIRGAGIDLPILLYGGTLPSREVAEALERLDVIATVTDAAGAGALAAHVRGAVRVFLKVDVGLERLGVTAEEAPAAARAIAALPGLELAGVYTHLHVPGGSGDDYAAWQLDRFDRALEELARAGVDPPVRMAESSASLGGPPRPRLNAIDPGHLHYGYAPYRPAATPKGLRLALRAVRTRLVAVRSVDRDVFRELSPVPLPESGPARSGIVPFGRSDGLGRFSTGYALVRGKRVPLAGRLSLEHARLDLTDVPDAEVGDEVVLLGRQGDEEIAPEEAMRLHDLDAVGLTLEVRASVPRVYVRT